MLWPDRVVDPTRENTWSSGHRLLHFSTGRCVIITRSVSGGWGTLDDGLIGAVHSFFGMLGLVEAVQPGRRGCVRVVTMLVRRSSGRRVS